jgi:hypothetical protein
MFLKGCQSLLELPNYLRFVVVCDILGLRKFGKYFERVAVQKSLRTPDLYYTMIIIIVKFGNNKLLGTGHLVWLRVSLTHFLGKRRDAQIQSNLVITNRLGLAKFVRYNQDSL